MLATFLSALLTALCLHPLVLALSFSSTGFGVGGSLGLSTFGLSSGDGDITAGSAGASGGPHNGINTHLSPSATQSDADEEVMASPGMGAISWLQLPTVGRYEALERETVLVKRKVKKRVEVGWTQKGKSCWVVSKTCCYEEVHVGYECKDFYEYKYARCHPVIEYAEMCSEVREDPAEHPKPAGRTKVEETVIKNYDANYGPHVDGYPQGGESEYYETAVIPHKPHGVRGEPHPPPQRYEHAGTAGAKEDQYEGGPVAEDGAYDWQAPHGETTTSGDGEKPYAAPPQATEPAPRSGPVAVGSESKSYRR